MKQKADENPTLTNEQLTVIRGLVGDAVAREDRSALEGAYRDFRSGMDTLRESFEQAKPTEGRAGIPRQAIGTYREMKR